MTRQLSDWLRSYLEYMEYSEAPKHFHFWAGVGAIAGALRRKVYIDQIYFRWSPNFYIIFVAPSGIATKSTAMNAGMDLLKELDNIHFGPNVLTWQALLPELEKAQEEILMPDGDYEVQSCITFASSEFGTLLDPQDRKMLDVLVDLWDGKTDSFKKETLTQGSHEATNAWLNIIACTTPSWLTDNMPRHVIGGGFTSRCLFIWGDKKEKLVAYPKKAALARLGQGSVQGLREALVSDLAQIADIAGEYEMAPDAEAYGTDWYERLHNNPDIALLTNNFDGYLARKQGHIHKLAMVISAAYKNERVITLDDLQKAILLVEALEKDMPKVFGHIRTDQTAMRMEEVLNLLHLHRKIERQALYRLVFTRFGMPMKEFEEIINSACAAGVVIQGTGMMLYSNLGEKQDQTPDTTEQNDVPTEAPSREVVDF